MATDAACIFNLNLYFDRIYWINRRESSFLSRVESSRIQSRGL